MASEPSAMGNVDSFFTRPVSHSVVLALFTGLGRLSFRTKWKLAELLCVNSLRRDSVLIEILSKNFSACLPDWSNEALNELMFVNTQETFYALMDRFRIWRSSETELRDQVSLANSQLLLKNVGVRPVVLLCPHFLGLEAAFQRISLEASCTALYRPSEGKVFETLRERARRRFGNQHLYSTDASMLPLLRRFRTGTPLFLLPDLDCGARSAVFAEFFGIEASTAPLTAWCAQQPNAVVLPVSVRRGSEGCYAVTIHEPITPVSADITEATGQVNAVIEQMVRANPQQYWWGQPRFATRPPDVANFYSDDVLNFARNAFGSAV